MIGHGKRQAGDDQVGQRVTGDIDPLPETVGAEQHARDIFLERGQQPRPRLALALDQQPEVMLVAEWFQLFCHPLHQAVAGEQYQGAASCFLKEDLQLFQ